MLEWVGTPQSTYRQFPTNLDEAGHSEQSEADIQVTTKAIVKDTVLTSKVKRISVRGQAELISEVSRSAGIAIPGSSKSNVHRIGKKVVKEVAQQVRDDIKSKKGSAMILHYDSKIVEDITQGKKKSNERLAVSVKIDDEDHLLGIPVCLNSTGECQTAKIIELLELYDIKDSISGLVFDTTSVNTGVHSGVNTRLNQYLERDVLHLACRHHQLECYVKNVSKIYRVTSGPDNPLFKRFKEELSTQDLDHSQLVKFVYGESEILDKAAKKSLEVMERLLTEKNLPRGDYFELAELVKFYLKLMRITRSKLNQQVRYIMLVL